MSAREQLKEICQTLENLNSERIRIDADHREQIKKLNNEILTQQGKLAIAIAMLQEKGATV